MKVRKYYILNKNRFNIAQMLNDFMRLDCKEDVDTLYTSNNINDIIRFYYCFDDVEELLKWSRSRPSAYINVSESEGNSDIVFVIPTPILKIN